VDGHCNVHKQIIQLKLNFWWRFLSQCHSVFSALLSHTALL